MSPTRMWVAEVNGRSVGFVQDYRIGDYPDYAVLGPDPDAIGVDYALGEEWSGRGFGAQVLWAWMVRARHRFPEATTYFAAPDHRNAASLRMLAKAGFTEGLWFDEPQEDGSVDTVVGCTLDVAPASWDDRPMTTHPLLLAPRPGGPGRDPDRRHARASTDGKKAGQRGHGRRTGPSSPTCRSACTPRAARRRRTGGCCWCCRAWTPPARAASCGTPSAWSTRRACGSRRSRRRPTEELEHDFLWRIRKALPEPGLHRRLRPLALRGRADRPGRGLAPPDEIEQRYDAINDFERELTEDGTVIVKCMLHISPEEQRERLLARLDDPTKHWKYNPGDLDDRAQWDDYRTAYELALERTNTEHAPWYVVPSDRKWYRNLAVGQLLHRRAARHGPRRGRPRTSTWTPNGPGCSRRTRSPDPFGRR